MNKGCRIAVPAGIRMGTGTTSRSRFKSSCLATAAQWTVCWLSWPTVCEVIAADAQSNHPQGNILIGCLGAEQEPPAGEHYIAKLQPNQTLMTCGDGAQHYLSASAIVIRHVNSLASRGH